MRIACPVHSVNFIAFITVVIIADGCDGFGSIKGSYIVLAAFSCTFRLSRAFFVLNPKYSGLFGIITIIFKNSKSNYELMFEKITASAMIHNDKTDRRPFFWHSRIFRAFALNKLISRRSLSFNSAVVIRLILYCSSQFSSSVCNIIIARECVCFRSFIDEMLQPKLSETTCTKTFVCSFRIF